MADLTGTIAQTESGVFERAKNSAQETVDSVKNTAGEWSDTAGAVLTGNSGVVEALKTDSHDEAAVRNISNMGSMATTGIAVASIVKGGMAAYASCTPAAALGTFGGVLAAGAVGAFAGAGLVKYLKLDEAWLDILGKPKLAKPGRQPATVGHAIAHSHPIAGAIGGLLAGIIIGVAVGAAVAAVAATGGLAAPLIVGALCGGFAGSFFGSLISGMCSKAATRSGQIEKGSPDVFFENQPVARVGDEVKCDQHSPTKQIAEGSTTIFVNNKPLARIGHKTTCSATIQQGCKTIFADESTGAYLKIDPELSAREQLFVSGAEVVITLGAGYLLTKIGQHCGEPINPADGSYFDFRTDFEYPSTLPLRLTRTYSGKDPVESVLGGRWICNWSQRLVYLTDEPTANLEDGEGEVLQFPLGKVPEFNSRNLKAAHYQLKGTRQQPEKKPAGILNQVRSILWQRK